MSYNDEDLFSIATDKSSVEPLAARMRPRTIDEYIGQEHIIGKGRLLRRAIQADLLTSVIFYGPPGTGKTTLARVIANTTKSHFSTLNAVLSGVKELRYEIDAARDRLKLYNRKTILFVDEVHRWNKSQQDALLPWVENGTIILIGATTENPYFEVNAALVSRSRIFQLTRLSRDEMMRVALQALNDSERGYGRYRISFEAGALEHLVDVADGDARSLLNALQLAVETTPKTFPPAQDEVIEITMEVAEESIQKKVVLYDKEGDYHFDVISAFIKSLRGSDPDAALYWLARMVAAGEDARFIFRRMLILACEDVGLADPQAITVVESCARAFDRIGLPEGRFLLTQSALYLSTCPKSNSSLGFFDALSDIEKMQAEEVPNHLKDPSRDGNDLGHGKGYLYPHSYKDHFVAQQYLPSSLQGKMYYHPSDQGYEAGIRQGVERRREAQLEAVSDSLFVENLTYSPENRAESRWLKRASSAGSALLLKIRDTLYDGLTIRRSDNILILNASHGLLLWEAMKHNPEGLCTAQVKSAEDKEYIDYYKAQLDELRQPEVITGSPGDVVSSLDPDLKYEYIFGRNVFTRLKKEEGLLNILFRALRAEGILRLCESVPSRGSALSQFVNDKTLKTQLMKAEETIYHSKTNAMSDWDENDIQPFFSRKFSTVTTKTMLSSEDRLLDKATLTQWITKSYIPSLEKQGFECDTLLERVLRECENRTVSWTHCLVFINATNSDAPSSSQKDWKDVMEKTRS